MKPAPIRSNNIDWSTNGLIISAPASNPAFKALIEDGKEKIEVYEGDEADEYIKEMNEKHGDDIDILIEKDSDDGKVKKKKKC